MPVPWSVARLEYIMLSNLPTTIFVLFFSIGQESSFLQLQLELHNAPSITLYLWSIYCHATYTVLKTIIFIVC